MSEVGHLSLRIQKISLVESERQDYMIKPVEMIIIPTWMRIKC